MMTSSNGIIFCVTGPLWGESTGDRWIPFTTTSDTELWCFLWCKRTVDHTDKMLVIWDTPWWSLWRHRNGVCVSPQLGTEGIVLRVARSSVPSPARFSRHYLEFIKGMPSNFAWWCILATFRADHIRSRFVYFPNSGASFTWWNKAKLRFQPSEKWKESQHCGFVWLIGFCGIVTMISCNCSPLGYKTRNRHCLGFLNIEWHLKLI